MGRQQLNPRRELEDNSTSVLQVGISSEVSVISGVKSRFGSFKGFDLLSVGILQISSGNNGIKKCILL